jgi:hypothetical protein
MCNPAQEINNAINTVGETGQKVISGVNKTIDNIARNPLPIIETAALMWVLGPEALALDLEPATIAAISSSAVSAANGGSVEQIALSAGASYLGSQIGQEAGSAVTPIEAKTLEQLGPQYADVALLKQIVTSSSASAATTALRGGDLNAILVSGISGGVSSAVSEQLKAQGYTTVDQKLLANATNAATRAILAGKDVATAIGASLASTTLAATISGNVGQINKNNELAKDLMSKYESLKDDAQKYFENNKLNDLYKASQDSYSVAQAAKNDYDALIKTYTDKYNYYADQKQKYESTNDNTYYDNATAAAKELNELAPTIEKSAASTTDAVNLYNTARSNYDTKANAYTNTYVNPLKDINSQIDSLSMSNQKLADALGVDVMKYQGLSNTDATNVAKNLYDQDVVDRAVASYRAADAQIAASGVNYAQADTGVVSDAGAGTTVQGVYKRAADGSWQEFIPDGQGGYTQVPMQVMVFANDQNIQEGQPTGNVYIVNENQEPILSPLSKTTADVQTIRTLKDGSTVAYQPDGTSVRTNPDGSTETYDPSGNLTNFTQATNPSGSDLFNALEVAYQNATKSGVQTGAVRNPDGSISVGDTTVRPDGTVTGTGAGASKINPDGSVSLGPVTIGGKTGFATNRSQDLLLEQKLIEDQRKAAEQAKAEADRQTAMNIASSPAKVNALQFGVASLIPQVQNTVTALSQPQTKPTEPQVVKTRDPLDIESPLETGYFGKQLQDQKDSQIQDGTVKIASGGSIGLPGLLRRRG